MEITSLRARSVHPHTLLRPAPNTLKAVSGHPAVLASDSPAATVHTMPTLYTFQNTDDIAIGLADFIKRAYQSAIERHGKFTIGLSGGSLPKTLGKALVPLPEGTFDYSKW
jgi:hypothetical protein